MLSITSLFRSNEMNANVMIEDEHQTVEPSARILPQGLRENRAMRSVLTTNWKDGAFDN
jgi:hypothetical protein